MTNNTLKYFGLLLVITAGCKDGEITALDRFSQKDPVVVTNGLIMYLPFENDIRDHGESRYQGISHGAPKFVEGIAGTCIEFDGVNDYIEFPSEQSPFPISTLTIVLWIDSRGSDEMTIKNYKRHILKFTPSSKDTFSPPSIYVGNYYDPYPPLPNDDNVVATEITLLDGSGSFSNSSLEPFDKKWGMYSTVVSYDFPNSPRPCAIGGWPYQEQSINGDITGCSWCNCYNSKATGSIIGGKLFLIGGEMNEGLKLYRYKGRIDEIRVYNRILTEQELLTIYQHYRATNHEP
jgi:hypothetical protein